MKLYTFLRDRFYAGGSMPTIREICYEMGWKAVGTAQDVVGALIEKGWIERDRKHARGLRLKGQEDLRAVPILGSAPAGPPVEAIEDHKGSAMIPTYIRGRVFGIRIDGDSMKNAGIDDGDIVIVKQTSQAQNNDIVVAMVDGEVTVKRFERRKNQIWLKPENPRYKPRLITDPSFRILGKIIGLHRYFGI